MVDIRKKLAGKHTKLANREKWKVEDHPARLDYYTNGHFYNAEIEYIYPDPDQPRKYFDEESLKELSQSIKDNGMLQPVVIRKDGDKFFIVAGERRYRAAKMAGFKKIPTIFTTGNPKEIALIENLQREDLKPIEEAEALSSMIKEYNYKQEELAKIIGKGRSTVTEILGLNKLPDDIKEQCRNSDISKMILIEIAKQKTDDKMISLFNQVKNNNLKGLRLRNVARNKDKKELSKIINFTKYLSKIDFYDLDDDKKSNLIKELKNLKKLIDEFIK